MSQRKSEATKWFCATNISRHRIYNFHLKLWIFKNLKIYNIHYFNRFPGIQGPQGIKGDKGLTGAKGDEGKNTNQICVYDE